ncbi:MAG: arginine--tRNA ligase [Bacillota bacterium]|jgi:arginyl-tRNA synthetase
MLMFKQQIAANLAPLLGWDEQRVIAALEIPPNSQMGDLAFPCFPLARELRKAPPAIAQDLTQRISPPQAVQECRAVGGYLNFFLDKQQLAQQVLQAVSKSGNAFGNSDQGEGKNIVIDFSSPNIAKPFGVGHLPTTMIGNSISKLYQALGYNVVRINHLGDWGTQFGTLIVAYLKWGDNDPLEEDPVQKLYRLYVRFHQEEEQHPELRDEARSWFKRLEEGDESARRLWDLFCTTSLRTLQALYQRLGVEFDHYTGESFYVDMLPETIQRVQAAGITEVSDGALIVPLGDDLPPCLLQKSDGATLYATRDLAALFYRHQQFNPERLLYVVAMDQSLHFQQLKLVLGRMGLGWADDVVHIPFGLVRLPQGKMSTRRGQMVLFEDLLEEAISRIDAIIAEKNPGLQNRQQVAEDVALGAIIFSNLKNSRIKDIIFDWNEMLNFDGETGPYLQYTHARALSVLRKAGSAGSVGEDLSGIADQESQAVLKLLSQFPEVIERAAQAYEPSTLSRYVLDLAQAFNRFYNSCRILGEAPAIEQSRLALVAATATVLRRGLELLGMKAPEQM